MTKFIPITEAIRGSRMRINTEMLALYREPPTDIWTLNGGGISKECKTLMLTIIVDPATDALKPTVIQIMETLEEVDMMIEGSAY